MNRDEQRGAAPGREELQLHTRAMPKRRKKLKLQGRAKPPRRKEQQRQLQKRNGLSLLSSRKAAKICGWLEPMRQNFSMDKGKMQERDKGTKAWKEVILQ